MKALKELIAYDYSFKIISNQLNEENQFEMVMELDKDNYHTNTFTSQNINTNISSQGKIQFKYLVKNTLNIKLLIINQPDQSAQGHLNLELLTDDQGSFTIELKDQQENIIASVTAKYYIQSQNTPILQFKKCKYTFANKETISKDISIAKLYFKVNDTNDYSRTQACQLNEGGFEWSEDSWLRINQNSEITLTLIDYTKVELTGQQIPLSSCKFTIQELKSQTSETKKYNALDSEGNIIGIFQLNYENPEIKQDNTNIIQKQIICAKIETLTYSKFQVNWQNCQKLFFIKLQLGKNTKSTKQLPKTEGKIQDTLILYGEDQKTTQINVYLMCQQTNKEPIIYGKTSVTIDPLTTKDYIINLSSKNQSVIELHFNCSIQKIPCKNLTIDRIVATIPQNSKKYGQLHNPYIAMRVGPCSARTEVSNQHITAFKTGISLTFPKDEKILHVQLWDKLPQKSRLIDQKQVQLSELSTITGDYQVKFGNQDGEDQDSQIKVEFNYQWNKYKYFPSESAQQQISKQQPAVSHNSKSYSVKQSPAKMTHPKQQPSKRQPMKQEFAKQEPAKSKPVISQNKKKQPQPIKEIPVNQSKESLILPHLTITKGLYGNAIFDKQSAATLQKSIVAFSVPKAIRFGNDPKYTGEPAYCIDTCFKPNTSKGVGFGFGGKKQFPDWLERNMKQNPPPGAYLQTFQQTHAKGPTFGISHKYYQKVLIKHQKPSINNSNIRKLSPISFHHRM